MLTASGMIAPVSGWLDRRRLSDKVASTPKSYAMADAPIPHEVSMISVAASDEAFANAAKVKSVPRRMKRRWPGKRGGSDAAPNPVAAYEWELLPVGNSHEL